MTSRPILFSAPMVRALLDGSKTQTRRVIKRQDIDARSAGSNSLGEVNLLDGTIIKCPYGQSANYGLSKQEQAGDQLWVRETWCDVYGSGGNERRRKKEVMYRADGETDPNVVPRWTPSIHMPHWASRITLEITSVRVERLQDISEADAAAEGWTRQSERSNDPEVHQDAARDWYSDLWEQINGAGSWNLNPWVWVIEFKKVIV